MTKKKALTGAIIIMVIWFALWGFGYWYLANQVNTASTRGFIQTSTEYLSKSDDFVDQYGQLSDIAAISEAPIKNESNDTTEYYMDFTCTTGNGEYSIRVYQTWTGTEKEGQWVLRYEALPAA